jgi:hypothetical protein
MVSRWQDWNPQVLAALREGVVIPAHPLALDANRKLDTRRQRALTRYYLDAGAGGLAVGVHTTQFAIREAGLFEPVLKLAMRSAEEWARASHDRGGSSVGPRRRSRRRSSRAGSAITPGSFRLPRSRARAKTS